MPPVSSSSRQGPSRRGPPPPSPAAIKHKALAARLYLAAARTNGRIGDILDQLRLSEVTFRQRLSRLRTAGWVRTLTLVNPLKLGRPYQCTTLVRLSLYAPVDMAAFEQALIDDRSVTCANQIAGDADYWITSYHEDRAAAVAWAQRLRCRPDVGEVRQTPVRQLFGHSLDGVVLLSAPPPERPPASLIVPPPPTAPARRRHNAPVLAAPGRQEPIAHISAP
ncbi:hypothetical protein [Caulobacter sp.]|uniref:hypothetical protein n=1 Tax=Caulobacter sp. TaxID=78 RepID=UPI0031D4AD7A